MVRPLKYDDKPQTETQRQRSINHDFIINRSSTIWFLNPKQVNNFIQKVKKFSLQRRTSIVITDDDDCRIF